MTYQNKEGNTVTLLENTATNKNGKVLYWVRLENGNTVSIWEDQFKSNFKKV